MLIPPPWPAHPPIRIVDVGAMSLGEGTEAYAGLIAARPCEVIGFEPLAEQCAMLNARGRPGHLYLPYAIGDGTDQTFHQCEVGFTSSLLEPDLAVAGRFQNLGELMKVVQTYPVRTARLDDLPQTAGVDYLKIDVQGGELMVLQGAMERLKTALVIHTEVEFLPLYKNQPLFSDIDAFLRARGFMFHRFAHLMGRTIKPLVFNDNLDASVGQSLWADAVYVRDLAGFDAMTPEALTKLAVIVHETYNAPDLAAAALLACDRQTGGGAMSAYLEWLKTRLAVQGMQVRRAD